MLLLCFFFFFSSRRRHTRWPRDWSSDVCSSDLRTARPASRARRARRRGRRSARRPRRDRTRDRKSTRLNSSHVAISYAVFCLKKKKSFAQHLRKLDARVRQRCFYVIEVANLAQI